ncbi:MAG TPA: carbonic anhydrase [Pseudobdellovibrionaceae bacterium]|jgi:carbonic anhydrase
MKILVMILAGLSLVNCSSKPAAETSSAHAPSAQSPVPPHLSAGTEPLKKQADKELEELKVPKKNSEITTPAVVSAAKPKTVPSKKHSVPRGPVASEKALGWLKNGNIRFVKHSLRNDGDTAKDRARVASSPNPHAIIISCSDSQVPPEIVFDQKLGEIFVIRTAGESLDTAAVASIEYGLEHFGSNLIVVLGHESCEAVKTALATLGGEDAGSPSMNRLMANLRPHLKSFEGKPLSEGTLIEGWANAEGVAKDLIGRSQIVRDALNTGEVKIQTALYHLGSGVVEFK